MSNRHQQPDFPRGDEWQSMTADEAVAHLQDWIANLDDPHEIARLMHEICGCAGAGYDDKTERIYYKIEE